MDNVRIQKPENSSKQIYLDMFFPQVTCGFLRQSLKSTCMKSNFTHQNLLLLSQKINLIKSFCASLVRGKIRSLRLNKKN